MGDAFHHDKADFAIVDEPKKLFRRQAELARRLRCTEKLSCHGGLPRRNQAYG